MNDLYPRHVRKDNSARDVYGATYPRLRSPITETDMGRRSSPKASRSVTVQGGLSSPGDSQTNLKGF